MTKTPYMVAIYLHGDDLVPDEVSQCLGVSPTESWRKGQKRDIKTRIVTTKSGLWRLSVTTSSMTLEDHFEELVHKFRARTVNSIWDIPGIERAVLDVYMLVSRDVARGKKDCGFCISSKHMRFFSQLGLELSVTFGTFSEDDDA